MWIKQFINWCTKMKLFGINSLQKCIMSLEQTPNHYVCEISMQFCLEITVIIFEFQEKRIALGYKAKFSIPSSMLIFVAIVCLVPDKHWKYWGLLSGWLETIMKYLLEKILLYYSITHERMNHEAESSQKPSIKANIIVSYLFHACFMALALVADYFFSTTNGVVLISESKKGIVSKNNATTTLMIWLNSAFS